MITTSHGMNRCSWHTPILAQRRCQLYAIMKIIFSRKGFDSASGGTPSPIFPDGRLLSLPIPDRRSTICYKDIRWHEYNLGTIVSELTRGRIHKTHRAHLDPDLYRKSLPRHRGWKPIFGQTGAARGHLRNQGIREGDVLLFFGLFQNVVFEGKRMVWDKRSQARHIIWGWLQVDHIVQVDTCDRKKLKWAAYHPHLNRTPDPNNTLYIARETLDLPVKMVKRRDGSGVFHRFSKKLQLTAPDVGGASVWELPKWIYPKDGRTPLTYHRNLSRWQRTDRATRLKTVPRGQEFVLDCKEYPEAKRWLYGLLIGK